MRPTFHCRFQLPANYRPNSRVVPKLSWARRCEIWLRSFQPNRLQTLQKQLVELSFSPSSEENKGVVTEYSQTVVDGENSINSVSFSVQNDQSYRTKHVVVVHGYGASLGCFARNFQLVNQFKGLKENYKVHFLDNLSFGLSSNPKLGSINYWAPVPKVDHLQLCDTTPTKKENLYKKYYKLIDSFQVDTKKFSAYKQKMVPVLEDMETYYTDALEGWRKANRIGKIDVLVGHSFGGYWSGSYALKYPESVANLVLLSPVGVERHAAAVTAPFEEGFGSKQAEAAGSDSRGETEPVATVKPSLDPTSYNFLSRFPLLSKSTITKWYWLQPYLPRMLRWMGPFGVSKYYDMWYSKLYAINKVIVKLGGEKVFSSENQLRYGTNSECQLLIEYLYNSITSGTHSDIHVKYLLTPSTTSRWPLYDKFAAASDGTLHSFKTHFVYGQYDFMCSEAGEKLVGELAERGAAVDYHTVAEGGHNLYIQNPFGTNELLAKIVAEA